ncbi:MULTISPECIES: hypothetical protein [unclassified Adlercreutzia]|uniref:hypothetical protein n=1 Tax=unclassified Adlercreutzia TaxID=2636013 RepID=UPI0013EA4646|nr:MULTISPECIES: hypothetical protein [unclassified Adlercreutzia]
MSQLDWYPVQVMSGQERKMVRLITAAYAEASELAEDDGVNSANDVDGCGETAGPDNAGDTAGALLAGNSSEMSEPDGADSRSELLKLDECFAPRYRTQKKMRGEWRDVERALMPGYLIAVANDPAKLAQCLRRVGGFCRVVKAGQTYVPLSAYERTWLEANTRRGDRVVPMSFGRKVGDALEVTQGPLKGYEGRITKVRRSDSLAFLEFHVGPMKIKTTVGLGILPE